MGNIFRVGCAAVLVCGLGACALGPVPARQRAEAGSDFPQDHPHPPPRLAGVPLDGSFDKLYCYNDGPNTICNRQ
jgi:hypothetical protein